MTIFHDHTICQKTALDTAEAICQERGIRMTPQRRLVLELIWKSHKPMKAYDLLEQMKHIENQAKPPTVYRALDFLLEHGLVHRISSLNAFTGCQHPKDLHDECFFLICQSCGNANECCGSSLTSAIQQAAKKQQFTPQRTVLEIAGICQECQ